jgi:hypothetical protein
MLFDAVDMSRLVLAFRPLDQELSFRSPRREIVVAKCSVNSHSGKPR